MYETTQQLIADDKISAGHDISDGGIAVTLLEAAFAGNCGIQVFRTVQVMQRTDLNPGGGGRGGVLCLLAEI